MDIAIIDYGAGNIRSVQFAFKRLGLEPKLSGSPEVIAKADYVVFPGVGEASSAMVKLRASGLHRLIPELKQPVLGICLGMQLMCRHSQENDTPGMEIFDCEVSRFPDTLKVPQIGWNSLYELKSPIFKGISEGAYMYSVHSYYAALCDSTIAKSDYQGPYSAALARDNFYGVQFHPEKSSDAGEQLLKNFISL